MDMYFWVFPIEEMEKRKKMLEKLFWATVQMVSRYNGKLYRDMALWVCGFGGSCVTI